MPIRSLKNVTKGIVTNDIKKNGLLIISDKKIKDLKKVTLSKVKLRYNIRNDVS